MWWPRLFLLIAVAALAGCGFHPLYGRSSGDPRIAPEMASVHVEPIADRVGQLVRNALLGRLNASGELRYRLEVKVIEDGSSPVLLQSDQTAAIDDVGYNADFTLFEGTTVLTKGTVSRTFSLDFLNQQYSNISARNFIERRAAEDIATQIQDSLATYFLRAAVARKAAGVADQAPPPAGNP